MNIKKLFISISLLLLLMNYQNCAQWVDSDHNGGSLNQSSSIDLLALEKEALSVLSQKCMSCHSATSTTAPIDITNKDKMIAEGYIVFGEPQSSPLYIDMIDGQMPPEDPLSDQDLQAIRTWILGEKSLTDSLSDILAPPGGDEPMAPSTFSEVRQLLAARCSNCHLNGNARGGVQLNNYNEIMRYVTANNTVASPLYSEVQRNEMPPNNPLTPTEKRVIYSWINDGARNN